MSMFHLLVAMLVLFAGFEFGRFYEKNGVNTKQPQPCTMSEHLSLGYKDQMACLGEVRDWDNFPLTEQYENVIHFPVVGKFIIAEQDFQCGIIGYRLVNPVNPCEIADKFIPISTAEKLVKAFAMYDMKLLDTKDGKYLFCQQACVEQGAAKDAWECDGHVIEKDESGWPKGSRFASADWCEFYKYSREKKKLLRRRRMKSESGQEINGCNYVFGICI